MFKFSRKTYITQYLTMLKWFRNLDRICSKKGKVLYMVKLPWYCASTEKKSHLKCIYVSTYVIRLSCWRTGMKSLPFAGRRCSDFTSAEQSMLTKCYCEIQPGIPALPECLMLQKFPKSNLGWELRSCGPTSSLQVTLPGDKWQDVLCVHLGALYAGKCVTSETNTHRLHDYSNL